MAESQNLLIFIFIIFLSHPLIYALFYESMSREKLSVSLEEKEDYNKINILASKISYFAHLETTPQ